ncbi:putative coiled-coil domain-containing protein, partial [Operophtera brumata]
SEKVDIEEPSAGQIGRGVGGAAITVDRDEYLLAHRELTFDRNQKRKLDHVLKPLENSMDLEESYKQKLFAYEELKVKAEREAKVEAVEEQHSDRLSHAEAKFDEIQNLEQTTGTGLIYSAKGKPIADKEQSTALCLRYIRARNAVADLDAIVRKLEMLGPGLYVAHYEQLNIDKQNYMTKIEERDDELIRNRAKCTEHNQILAHIREKMHHTDENRRDKLRWSLEGEKLKAGLLTRKDLLRDFQDGTDEVVKLREQKVCLEAQISKTTTELREARKRMQVPRLPTRKSSTTIVNNADDIP